MHTARMHTAQMHRLLKNLQSPLVGFPLTGRSLLSSQPPRTSSGWCYAGSAGIAGLPLPSYTAASDAHSHDLLLHSVYFTEQETGKHTCIKNQVLRCHMGQCESHK